MNSENVAIQEQVAQLREQLAPVEQMKKQTVEVTHSMLLDSVGQLATKLQESTECVARLMQENEALRLSSGNSSSSSNVVAKPVQGNAVPPPPTDLPLSCMGG